GLVAQEARDAVDEGGLARAVGTDQAEALARGDFQAHVGQGREAAEVLRDAAYLEEALSHRLKNPRMPSGASTTNSTSSTPTTSTLISLEMVTVTICWMVTSSSAPITGPSQCVVPPIIGAASVPMAKKMPRSRSVSMPTPKPRRPPIAAPAAICTASGAPSHLNSTTAVYAPTPKNAGVPKFT